jgi:hypothetical protein
MTAFRRLLAGDLPAGTSGVYRHSSPMVPPHTRRRFGSHPSPGGESAGMLPALVQGVIEASASRMATIASDGTDPPSEGAKTLT